MPLSREQFAHLLNVFVFQCNSPLTMWSLSNRTYLFLETFINACKFHIKLNEQCYISRIHIILIPEKQHSIKGCTQANRGSDAAPFSPPPSSSSSAQRSPLSPLVIHVFISSPHVYLTYASLSQWELGRVWHQLRCKPRYHHTHHVNRLPPFITPSRKEHIPTSSCRKDTHVPWS